MITSSLILGRKDMNRESVEHFWQTRVYWFVGLPVGLGLGNSTTGLQDTLCYWTEDS
jgi:hypothetical protein